MDISPNEPEVSPGFDGENVITVSAQGELERAILGMVRERVERGLFRIVSTDDIEDMVVRAIEEVNMAPLVAYATSTILPIRDERVGYTELELVISYRKTAEQITGVRTVQSGFFVTMLLSEMLHAGESYLAMLGPAEIANIDVGEFILEQYYTRPLEHIVLPRLQTGLYPSSGTGSQRIVVVELDFGVSSLELAWKRAQLMGAAQEILFTLPEDDEISIQQQIYYLAEALAERVAPPLEEEPQADLAELRPLSTTAFGALVEGYATSEGYAMAFQALMNLFGVDVHVVQGEREGLRHVWNIVGIDGYYYHVDVSLFRLLGAEYTLFLSNEIMLNQMGYSWDIRVYPLADGPMLEW